VKKVIVVLFLLLSLTACGNRKEYSDFYNYTELEIIFQDMRRDNGRFMQRYRFLDVRSLSERQVSCPRLFTFHTRGSVLNDMSNMGVRNRDYIIIMGTNSDDQRPHEIRALLVENGFRNVVIYLGGFENYLLNPNARIERNCSTNCGC